jgi:DNA-binding LacI/PurR family transcriptional regulator
MESKPTPSRISVREIAKRMGLSHATVSMALRGNTRVSAQTREKVRRYAESIGYRPDPMLGALAHYRQSKTRAAMKAGVAWINAWPDPDQLRKYREFDGYWKGAQSEAEKFGYRMEEFRMGPDCSPGRLHRILQARGIRGILLPPHRDHPDWEDFPWKEYAVVRMGRSLKSPQTHLVASNQLANAMLAFTAMRERGYDRVAFATGRFELGPYGHLFGAGWIAAQEMIKPEERIPSFMFMLYPLEKRATLFRQWLDEFRPEAILTDVPQILEMLNQAGVRIPQDLGVAGTTLLDLDLDSGIDQHAEEIGRTGFLMLNSLINEGARGEPGVMRQLLVQGHWVDGSSLPHKRTEHDARS